LKATVDRFSINNHQSTIRFPLLIIWIAFNLFALALLALDLLVLNRPGRAAGPRGALLRTALWFALALAFSCVVLFWQGRQVAVEFFTGYVVELSLSVDNLFIFLVIFRYFAVPEEQQHRVLIWGILGALAMRGLLIITGVSLIERFHWVFYILGTFLVYSGIRLGIAKNENSSDPSRNPAVKALRRLIPVTSDYHGGRFFVRNWQGRPGLYATPLLAVLVVIETSDLLFAVDSVPAVLAITLNAFIVYAANVFAILGLRSLFFAVSGLMKNFRFLHTGLALILILIGIEMIVEDRFKIPTLVTLGLVAAVLGISIAVSVKFPLAPRQA
jgi:tellurite resistance protein TerC